MALTPASIRPLPPESQAQIRSSVVITSLNDAIIGFLENVLDAGATSAEIRLDYVKGYCSVNDNGIGIPEAEFERDGHLGSLHCTSKLSVPRATYGRYGRFLYHLAALSLLSITSKYGSTTSMITLHRASIIARSGGATDYAASIRGDHGTHVVAANLFGDIPVRFRRIATRLGSITGADAEFATLRKRIAALILSCGRAIDIKVINIRTKRNYKHKSKFFKTRTSFDVTAICSALQQAGYIESSQAASFKSISVQTSSIRIRAMVSLLPAPAKDVQFISIGIRPVHVHSWNSLFSDEINAVFKLSSFGAMEDDFDLSEEKQDRRCKDGRSASDRHSNRQLNGQKKGVDRWPMFYVRIDPQDARASTPFNDEQSELGLAQKWVGKVLDLLRSMFVEFLSLHHFHPQVRERRRLKKSSLNQVASVYDSLVPTLTLPLRAVSEPGLIPRHFDAWSRVKTGATSAKSMHILASFPEQGYLEIGQYTTPQLQTPAERVQAAQNALGKIELQTLNNQNLELLFADYNDEAQSDNEEPGPDGAGNYDLDSNNGYAPDADEGIHLWTSPATGIEHKISARNGLILPQPKMSHTKNSESSTHTNDSERLDFAPADASLTQRIRVRPAKKSPAELIAAIQKTNLIRYFRPVEGRIPSIVPGEHEEIATAQRSHNCGHSRIKRSEYFSAPSNVHFHNLSKADLKTASVLAQVDQKFILVQTQAVDDSNPLLVLIDQHAADERVKVEELYTQLCSGEAAVLSKPIIFEVPLRETELFHRHRARFAKWQTKYEVKDKASKRDTSSQVVVRTLPSLISERCRLDPKLLVDLLRREVNQPSSACSSITTSVDWIHRIPHCPRGLIDMVNSRACRSAIMFNDVLDVEQCEELLKKLTSCTLPFQCAHGRPSCVVLPGWAGKEQVNKDDTSFVDGFRQWKHI